MIFADTGWFVALVNPNDALHNRALRWLAAISEPIATTEYVLLETFNALSSASIRRRCHEVISRTVVDLQIQLVRGDTALFNAGMKMHRDRTDKAWSLADCISFQLMLRSEMTQALAHDHHFEQAGFEALLRRDPD